MFFVTNLPRLLLNLYELFNVNDMIECGDLFFPPAWFICSTSVNHLLLILNSIMNFVVYASFNESFQNVIFRRRPGSMNEGRRNESRRLQDSNEVRLNNKQNGGQDSNHQLNGAAQARSPSGGAIMLVERKELVNVNDKKQTQNPSPVCQVVVSASAPAMQVADFAKSGKILDVFLRSFLAFLGNFGQILNLKLSEIF